MKELSTIASAVQPSTTLKVDALYKQMKEEGKYAEALTLWERVLDRTTTTEENRSGARQQIINLRPKIQINTDPDKSRKWNVLILIYKEINAEQTNQDESVTAIRQVFTQDDFAQIGRSLAGFRDMVFEWSSGIVLLDFEVVFVEEPIIYQQGLRGSFPLHPHHVAETYKNVVNGKKYDTVIAYVKFRGSEGPELRRPWIAAVYGRIAELDNAAYMMVPWGPDYPLRGERYGEMELHEWLHQIDDIVHINLGYPRGTSRSPDDGRTVDDVRTDGEQEYKRPRDVTTWVYFYRHLMDVRMTRQIWSELALDPEVKPGTVITIEE